MAAMMLERQFRLRPVPELREGSYHYLVRLVEINGYDTRWIWQRIGKSRSAIMEYVKDAVDVDAFASRGLEDIRTWITKFGRICPRCLEENNGKESVGWEIRYSDACINHECWLVDQCVCGARINPLRVRLNECSCGIRLSSLATRSAPAAVATLSAMLIGCVSSRIPELLSTRPSTSNPFRNLRVHELQTIIRIFGFFGDPNSPPRTSGVPCSLLLVDSWSITSLAAEVIVDWPGAFHRLLAWNQARNDDPRALHLRRRLGRLYHHIYVTLRDPRYEFIRAELENYLTTHWPAVTGGNRKRTQHLSDTRWSWWPMMRACKSLGVSRAVLRDLIDRGVLEADRRITERGRKRVFVRGVRLNGEPLSDSFVTCKAAAKTLGLNNARLRAMIPTLFPKAWKGSDFVWRIPTIEVDALCHVGCRMAPASESGSSLVTLAHALQYLRLSNSSLAQIVTQAKDHVKHRPVGKQSPHRGLRSWIFERSYIENIIRNSSTPTADGQSRMLSVRQLAHRWDIRRQTMYKFLTSGALAILALPRGAGGERLIAIEEIESFERRYVFAMEITKRLGCTCKRLMHALRVRGIEAANAKRKAGRVVFERTPELENAVAEIALMLAERTNDVTLKQETPHGRFPPPTMQASTTRQNLH